MRQIIFFLFCITSLFSYTQVNNTGNPIVNNFAPIEYKAAEQNWSITQDNRGVMYIGNHAGVIEYDGNNWRMIPVDNNSAVRSLDVDENGRVYVGAVGEFGYLRPDKIGNMEYVSLLEKTDTAFHDFSEVWKLYANNNTVHFSVRSGFFTYHSKEDTVIAYKHNSYFRENIYPLFTFLHNDDIFVGTYIKGLLKLDGEEFVEIPGSEFFARKNVFSVLEYDDDNLMICTDNNGVFLYNMNTYEIDDNFFEEKTQQLLSESYLFHTIKLPENRFGFATSQRIIITDKTGNIEAIVDNNNGLQDPTSYFLYHNSKEKDAPIWAALNNGVSYIHALNPVKKFNESSGLIGLIMDIVSFDNKIVVATTSGVFYLQTYPTKPAEFIEIEGINMFVYALDIWLNPVTNQKEIIVAARGEVFRVDHNFRVRSITKTIPDKTHNALEVLSSDVYPDRIYLGLSGGLEIIEYKNGSWNVSVLKDYFPNEIRAIVEEDNGDLWVASHLVGYGRFQFKGDEINFTKYDSKDGLPEDLNLLKLFKYDNRILFASSEGIYVFDDETETFLYDTIINHDDANRERGYFSFAEDNSKNLWMSGYIGQQKIWIEKAEKNNDGTFDFITNPFKILPSLWCDAIFVDDNDVVWMGISDQLYSYNNNVQKDYNQTFNTIIRNVSTLGDSLIFAGTNFAKNSIGENMVASDQPESIKPVLKYEFNNLSFTFSSTFFEAQDDIEYSYNLEGFDNWSRWSPETKAVYSYIPVGSYTFRVKARNVYGQESIPATFEFVILSPWYRTVWAYIGYAIILIIIVYVIIILNTRRLQREKEILEGIVKERTAEVVQQKEKIEKQNENITNSIQYAKRIQTAALPPDDFIDELIPERFILFMPRDIVSGDFYWIGKMGDKVIAVAADCTGHGVPGGFMSMLGISYLNQIVSSNNDYNAGEILDHLRYQVMKSLRQEDESSESRDGMDIALIVFHKDKKTIEFAGANNPLYVIRNNEILETPGDKMPIGIHRRADRNFVNNKVEVQKGDMLYVFSDGYKDQFGGAEGKKFMSKNFKQILIDVHTKPVDEQRDILEKTIIDWTGNYERIDDIIVIGIRV